LYWVDGNNGPAHPSWWDSLYPQTLCIPLATRQVPWADARPEPAWGLLGLGPKGASAALDLARRGAQAGSPPVHLLLAFDTVPDSREVDRPPNGSASQDAYPPEAPAPPVSCALTLLATGPTSAGGIAAAGTWRRLTTSAFTVRVVKPDEGLPWCCGPATARAIKEELRLWPN